MLTACAARNKLWSLTSLKVSRTTTVVSTRVGTPSHSLRVSFAFFAGWSAFRKPKESTWHRPIRSSTSLF